MADPRPAQKGSRIQRGRPLTANRQNPPEHLAARLAVIGQRSGDGRRETGDGSCGRREAGGERRALLRRGNLVPHQAKEAG